MNDKQKNKKTATGEASSTTATITPPTIPLIPKSVSSKIDSFAQLKELAYVVERHYDRYTDSEEKASLNKLLTNLTEINVANLTTQLNDVEKSQAAMLIRQIIKDHALLKQVHLQDNVFSPPDLQFIIKALIYVFYEPGKKYQISKVNFNNSINEENLERSAAEIMQLRKAYGNNILLDTPVYNHFIDNYRKVTTHYLLYLAKKIILPKANQTPGGTPEEILTAADAVIRQGLAEGTKNIIRFELAVKKYQAVSLLTEILNSGTATDVIFERFQTQYKLSKKVLTKSINKDDDTHLERFYEQIGDVKPQVFIPVKRDSHSIFKTEPKKKKKTKRKARAKKATTANKKLSQHAGA
jgi:hypothetical protein